MKLSPKARPQVDEKTRKRLRLVRPLLVMFGLVFAVSIFLAPKSSEKQPADETAATLYEICKVKLEQAKELDVLADLNAKGPSINVTVGSAFFTVPIDTQQEFARTVNCFFAKGADRGVSFDLIHWQTGKKVASWNGDRLDVD